MSLPYLGLKSFILKDSLSVGIPKSASYWCRCPPDRFAHFFAMVSVEGSGTLEQFSFFESTECGVLMSANLLLVGNFNIFESLAIRLKAFDCQAV